IVIAGPDAALANNIASAITKDKGSNTTVEVKAPATASDRDSLVARVREKQVDGLLWIDTSGADPKATYTSQSSGDIVVSSRLQSALNQAIVAERLAARGLTSSDVDRLMKDVRFVTLQVDKGGKEVKSSGIGSYLKGYIMGVLLAMTTMIYGMNVARSIIQEKTSRIFEVMLATAKPSDLLGGKLLGVGAVGLTQLAIWVIVGGALAGSALAGPVISGQLAIHF